MDFLFSLIGGALGYFAGSLNSAILVSRALNLPDPRENGSGNPGATNVLRLAGTKPAGLVFLGDVLKGVVPVLLMRLMSDNPTVWALAGLGAFFGHIYPYFFNFKGGKGVATAFGVIMASNPLLGLGLLATWGGVFYKTRISSLSALSAMISAPIWSAIFYATSPLFISLLVMIGFLVHNHKDNIERLKNGQEKAFNQ